MSHRLTTHDNWFLAMGRVDPIAKEPFRTGDEVVVCAKCRTVHLADIWDMCQQCAVCGNKSQASAFSRSLIDFSYGRNTSAALRWLRLPMLHRLKSLLVYGLTPALVLVCLILAFTAGGTPLEDLSAAWRMGLQCILDWCGVLGETVAAAAVDLAEAAAELLEKLWSRICLKTEAAELDLRLEAVVRGLAWAPLVLWRWVQYYWNLICGWFLDLFQWVRGFFA